MLVFRILKIMETHEAVNYTCGSSEDRSAFCIKLHYTAFVLSCLWAKEPYCIEMLHPPGHAIIAVVLRGTITSHLVLERIRFALSW